MRSALATLVLVTLAAGPAGPLRGVSAMEAQFWGTWGDWFKKPTGGDICFDGDGTVVPCPGTEMPRRGGNPEQPDDGTWLEERKDKDDTVCNLCHVNRTNEVAGPPRLSDAVLADPARFWRNHGAIAARIKARQTLAAIRSTPALTPALQRLMASRPAR
ncbi:MAG: hypothetical protein AB7U83_24265 [Vicinamibacterales bacterium]